MKSIIVHISHRAACLFILHYCLLQFCFSQCWVYEKSGTNNDLWSVCFTDSLTGIAVGSGGIMLQTTDGGTTWTKLRTVINANLGAVSFLDKNIGMVGGSGDVLYTNNDGASWTMENISYYNLPLGFYGISVLDSNRAVVGSDRAIFKTFDHGTTWTLTLNTASYRLSFANANIGASISSYRDYVYRTTDGGSTWAGIFTPQAFTGVSTPDSNSIIVVTMEGNVFRSNDGGATWAQQNVTMPTGENNVSFADSLHGVIVSSDGPAFITGDGGSTWTPMKTPSTYIPTLANYVGYSEVTYAGNNSAIAVGQHGTIIKMVDNCSQVLAPSSPLSGASHQLLTQLKPGQFSVALRWDFPAFVDIISRRVQAGTDSSFNSGLVLDTNLVSGMYAPGPNAVTLLNVLPKKTYYWRVKVDFNDSTSTGWTGPWVFTTAGASISGVLFNDINDDSLREAGEPGLANWRADISGKIQESMYTDSNGVYSFGGLDSGTYIVTQEIPPVWRRTSPSFTSYSLTPGVGDSITGIDFGDAYPWNSIEGTVYLDINKNGIRDNGEPGLGHWVVTLIGVDSSAMTQSDSIGQYTFNHVNPGTNTVELTAQPSFEQETPEFGQGYSIDVETYGDRYSGFDFGVLKIPLRVKVPLTVYDNTLVNRRDIWFGIRPGATYGIWGVDPKASNVDFSEGEFEIPPQTPGLFDARFQDPHGGLTRFGYGSWTDMRNFVSTTQSDTFLVTFAPGYYFNGNYPMTIQWALSDIRNAFPTVSPVLTDPRGNRISMWNGSGDTARAIISDSTISYVYITTQSPNFPAVAARQWNLVSIPQNIPNDYINNIFTTADSSAISYVTGTGYIKQDTLLPGKGYWVHYSAFIDSLQPIPLARLHDTVNLRAGWNLLGSLSSPLIVAGITTIPSGSISSEFFAYNKGYSVTDTLLPTQGYWIKASQAAGMILNALGTAAVRKTVAGNEILKTSDALLFSDNAGNMERLYCRAVSAGDKNTVADLYEAPPLPPEGVFDVRFSSNRILETVVEQQTGTLPVMMQGAEYPITVSWQANSNSVSASIVIDGKEIPLNGKTDVQIVSPGSSISLKLSGMPAVPSAFALEQNYPNPFNPTTTLRYALPTDSKVTLKVYNVLGQVVATLVNGVVGAGYQSARWNANTVASGIYFYRIDATSLRSTGNTFTQVKKMVLVK